MSSTDNTDTSLYTTMSIFVGKAPRLISHIEQAVEAENMETLESYAAQLFVCAGNAGLEGFTGRIKNLIVAARENKFQIVKEHAKDIKQSFENLTKPMELPA
jgi:hypothetical protein